MAPLTPTDDELLELLRAVVQTEHETDLGELGQQMDRIVQKARAFLKDETIGRARLAIANPYASNLFARDYFAGQALTGFLAAFAGENVRLPEPSSTAREAYRYADAMLEARRQ